MIRAKTLPDWMARAGLLLAIVFCFAPTEAAAHQVNLFATVEDGQITGKVYFRGGPPAQNVGVAALDPAGRELGKTTTDAEGRFHLQARYRCNTKLIADAGDGHAAAYLLETTEFPDDLPAPDGAAVPPPAIAQSAKSDASDAAADPAVAAPLDARQVKSLHKEIGKLREDLDAFRQEIRLRDVLGGLGYILGLSGVAFYVLGRRGKK